MSEDPPLGGRSRGTPVERAVARTIARLGPHERIPVRWRKVARPATVRLRFMGVRPEDALLASYPRSGSTWVRFLLTDIITRGGGDWTLVNRVIPDAGKHVDAPKALPGGGRLIKTHDRHAGPSRRAVYLVRDVRDVILSEYRWELRDGIHRSLDEQIDLSLAGRTPMSLFGSWGEHVAYWLDSELARRGDLLLMKFEDFRREPIPRLRDLVDFLGIEAVDDQLDGAVENNSLNRMRDREERSVNAGISAGDPRYPWIGQGAVMGWRSKLTEEQVARLESSLGGLLARLGYPTSGG